MLLRVGMAVEAGTHLVLALTRTPWVAGLTLSAFGVHAAIWSILTVTLRQQLVPDELGGRVNSAYALFSTGGAALGALLGGILAHDFGITAPFWFGFVGSALLVAVLWRRFDDIVHAGDVT
jgi:MFS family permease